MFVCLFLFQYLKIIRLISAPLFIKAPSEKSTLQRNLLTPVCLPLLQGATSWTGAAELCLHWNGRLVVWSGPSLTSDRNKCAHSAHKTQRVTVYGLHARMQTLAQCRCECIPAVEQASVAEVQGNCGSFVFFEVTQLQNNWMLFPGRVSETQINTISQLLIQLNLQGIFLPVPCFAWLGTTQYDKGECIRLIVLEVSGAIPQASNGSLSCIFIVRITPMKTPGCVWRICIAQFNKQSWKCRRHFKGQTALSVWLQAMQHLHGPEESHPLYSQAFPQRMWTFGSE